MLGADVKVQVTLSSGTETPNMKRRKMQRRPAQDAYCVPIHSLYTPLVMLLTHAWLFKYH